MRLGSLFAGIGGFDLAARWVGWETAWFSEIDPYASAVLAKHWPGVPNHGDITKIRGADVEPVDLLCGGFPCQDISLAGKGAGVNGSRSGLWGEYARLIGELRPKWVVIENVPALRSRGLDQVLGALAALGYDAEWHCVPAAAVGAPHQRDRIWVVAYPEGYLRGTSWDAVVDALDGAGAAVAYPDQYAGQQRRASDAQEGPGGWDTGRSVVCTDLAHAAEQPEREQDHQANAVADDRETWSLLGGGSWWAVEPDVGRVAHGVPARVDRLRCLGNAIVPQVAFRIFQAIQAHGD